MSTSVPQINSASGLGTSSTLTNSGANGSLQILGLASGINTNAVIQAELAGQEQPLNNLKLEMAGLKTQSSQLAQAQSSLQNVSFDALLLGEPSLFFLTQPITSSNPTAVTAQTSNGPGAPIGASTVTVANLASSAQTSFAFTSPTSGSETLSISDGVNPAQSLTVAAGASAQDVADQINGSDTQTVWASVSQSGQLVLSARNTGSNYTVTATNTTTPGNLTQASTVAGLDAQYTINGVPGSSHTDTVTGAIPGVTLKLQAVTAAGSPVTVTVPAPGPDVNGIISTIKQFVSDYNATTGAIQGTINTPPASETQVGSYNPNDGSLFGDPGLENLLSNMRSTIYAPGSGLPTGLAALSDIGVSTGASTGALNQNAVSGQLTVNTDVLTAAIEKNPRSVESVLQSFAQSFRTLVNGQAAPGGAIDARINGSNQLISSLQSQYNSMNQILQQQQADMEQQWAQVEATLNQLHSQTTSLTAITSGWFGQKSTSG